MRVVTRKPTIDITSHTHRAPIPVSTAGEMGGGAGSRVKSWQ